MTDQETILKPLQRIVPAGIGVHVLAYHLVDAGTRSPVDVPLADFRRQMEELAERRTVLPLDVAVERLSGHLDKPAVVLTFDDAYRNFATTAWPILRDLNLPVTLFVPTAFIEDGGPVPMAVASNLPPMSWRELAECRREGVTLGSHGHSHAELPSLDPTAADADLERARRLLHRSTGCEADLFCYPRAVRSAASETVVARHHRTACVAGGTLNRPGRFHPLRVSRVPVRRHLGPSLRPILDSTVWLSEWLASRVRHMRRAVRRHKTLGAR